MNRDVLVVIGAGGIGLAIARRQGTGKCVLLADFNETPRGVYQVGHKRAVSDVEHHGEDASCQSHDVEVLDP